MDAPLIPAFHRHLERGQISWLDELLPPSIPWLDKRTLKISYVNESPEAQVKLKECFPLKEKEHPTLCEGRLPLLLNICTPDGKKLSSTTNLPHFLTREWPKHRQTVMKKFPVHVWP
jgi:ATP-dependent helicase HrpB